MDLQDSMAQCRTKKWNVNHEIMLAIGLKSKISSELHLKQAAQRRSHLDDSFSLFQCAKRTGFAFVKLSNIIWVAIEFNNPLVCVDKQTYVDFAAEQGGLNRTTGAVNQRPDNSRQSLSYLQI